MSFVKIFRGYPYEIENAINEMVRERNLDIISVSSYVNQGTMYVTVVFKKRGND